MCGGGTLYARAGTCRRLLSHPTFCCPAALCCVARCGAPACVRRSLSALPTLSRINRCLLLASSLQWLLAWPSPVSRPFCISFGNWQEQDCHCCCDLHHVSSTCRSVVMHATVRHAQPRSCAMLCPRSCPLSLHTARLQSWPLLLPTCPAARSTPVSIDSSAHSMLASCGVWWLLLASRCLLIRCHCDCWRHRLNHPTCRTFTAASPVCAAVTLGLALVRHLAGLHPLVACIQRPGWFGPNWHPEPSPCLVNFNRQVSTLSPGQAAANMLGQFVGGERALPCWLHSFTKTTLSFCMLAAQLMCSAAPRRRRYAKNEQHAAQPNLCRLLHASPPSHCPRSHPGILLPVCHNPPRELFHPGDQHHCAWSVCGQRHVSR